MSLIDLQGLWIEPPLNPLLVDDSSLGELARKNRKVPAGGGGQAPSN